MAAQKKPFEMPKLKACPFAWQPAPADCYDFDRLAKVIVGKEKKIYQLHAKLLSWYSTYFATVLNGRFKASKTQTVNLPDEELEVFEAFRSWIYTGRFENTYLTQSDPNSKPPNKAYCLICKTFEFADRRGVPGLKNEAIDRLHEITTIHWTFPMDCVGHSYANTPDGSTLRKYLANMYTSTKAPSHGAKELRESKSRYSGAPDFLIDVIVSLEARGGKWGPPSQRGWSWVDRCQYHDHEGVAVQRVAQVKEVKGTP